MSILKSMLEHPGKIVYGSPFSLTHNFYSERTTNSVAQNVSLFFNCETSQVNPYYCQICLFETDLVVLLNRHIDNYHTLEIQNGKRLSPVEYYTIENYICEQCNFQSYSAIKWLHHASKCVKNEQSEDMNEDFRREHQYEESLLNFAEVCTVKNQSNGHKSLNDVIWYKCEQCEFKSTEKTSLTQHELIKHAVKNQWLQCEKCPFVSKYKSTLRHHMFALHTPDKWFECDNDFKSTNKTEWRLQTDSVDLTTDKYFNCDKCSYKTTKKDPLKKHIINKHLSESEIKWYHCEQCSYKAKQKSYLQNHVKVVHSDEKPFCCNWCPFKSKFKHDLYNHIKNRHLSGKEISLYCCERCPYSAKNKKSLKCHFEVAHCGGRDIKWHKCDQCSYKTSRRGCLRLHVDKVHRCRAKAKTLLNEDKT